jgi:hypothetical protein
VAPPSLRLAEQSRVIVDNDWSGDPDGLVALAHHLLSPTNRVVAVTSSFLDPVSGSPQASAEDGAALARELLEVWIGGAIDAAADEYNRGTDPGAAAFVVGTPGLEIWQFPLETYRSCAYSVAELEHDVGGSGQVGQWLWTRFTELPLPDFIRLGGVWPPGDSPPVLVTALSDESSAYTETAAAPAGATRRVYTDVDVRLLFGDMLARLRHHESRRARAGDGSPGVPAPGI